MCVCVYVCEWVEGTSNPDTVVWRYIIDEEVMPDIAEPFVSTRIRTCVSVSL